MGPRADARRSQERSRLGEFAKTNGIFVEQFPDFVDKSEIGGNEHLVDLENLDGRVEKYTLAVRPSALTIILDEKLRPVRLRHAFPSEYLERLILQNEIFGDDVHLKAFSAEHRFKVSQPYRDGTLPTPQAIGNHLEQQGFKLKLNPADETYFHHESERLIVADTKPENWMTDEDQNIVPIDVIIVKIHE